MRAVEKSSPSDKNSITFLTLFRKKKQSFFATNLWFNTRGRTFLPNLKDGVSSP